jgi:beta-galactosidase
VEAVCRGDLLFLLHHGRGEVSVAVPGRYRELLSGEPAEGTVTLGRYGVAVLEEAPGRPHRVEGR